VPRAGKEDRPELAGLVVMEGKEEKVAMARHSVVEDTVVPVALQVPLDLLVRLARLVRLASLFGRTLISRHWWPSLRLSLDKCTLQEARRQCAPLILRTAFHEAASSVNRKCNYRHGFLAPSRPYKLLLHETRRPRPSGFCAPLAWP